MDQNYTLNWLIFLHFQFSHNQPLVGILLDMMWNGNVSAGVRLYDAADYRLSFLSILGSAVIGLIAALSLNEVPLAQRKN